MLVLPGLLLLAAAACMAAAAIVDIISELNLSFWSILDLAFNKLIISSIGMDTAAFAFCCSCCCCAAAAITALCCCCFCLRSMASNASSEAFRRLAQYLDWCACRLLTDLNLIPQPSQTKRGRGGVVMPGGGMSKPGDIC